MQKSKLLKTAAETEEQPVSLAEIVLAYARKHRDEVFESDREIPERFKDLRPSSKTDVDPGDFLVPSIFTKAPGEEDPALLSNRKIFTKRYAERDGVYPIEGDNGATAIAIRISAITGGMLEDLEALDSATTPDADEVEQSKAKHLKIDQAWNEWTRYDFIRALEEFFPSDQELIDGLDEDQTREIFDRARRRVGAEWIEEGDTLFIDVNQVAAALTGSDLKS